MNLLPKDDVFFNLFINSGNNVYESAILLKEILDDTSDIEAKVKIMKETEEECDKNTHNILSQLNKSFVTPLDREDIYQIAKELDEIVDCIEDVAHWLLVFNIREVRSEALILSNLIIDCAKEIQATMKILKNMKNPKELYQKIIEINRIENEGDSIFRDAVKKIFNEKDMETLEVIKWKNIFEYLENTLDACEDVANTIEGVVMKHA